MEEAHFLRMLRQVNILYLGTSVLLLIDLSYVSRFWVRLGSNRSQSLSMWPPRSVITQRLCRVSPRADAIRGGESSATAVPSWCSGLIRRVRITA